MGGCHFGFPPVGRVKSCASGGAVLSVEVMGPLAQALSGIPGGLRWTRHPTKRELKMTTDGTSGASKHNSQYNRDGESNVEQQQATRQDPTKQIPTKQDSGKRLVKLAVAIALLLVVAVFVVVLLITGRTDDDQPEQPRPAVTSTSTG